MLPDPHDNPDFYDHLMTKRLLAWVIDLALTLILVVLAIVLSAFLLLFIFPLAWAAVAIAYRTVSLSRWGATPGMMVAAIKLRRLDGRRPDPMLAFQHSALYALQMGFVFPQVVSVVMMLSTPYRQGLNDWLLGTTIINRYDEG